MPPILASVGRVFVPPTYFCTRSILIAGTIDLRAAVELDLQVLFLLALLLDQPQAAIPADAVGQMDDQVALAQVEERIDRLAQPPPRQPPQLAAVKQLAGGEDQSALAE